MKRVRFAVVFLVLLVLVGCSICRRCHGQDRGPFDRGDRVLDATGVAEFQCAFISYANVCGVRGLADLVTKTLTGSASLPSGTDTDTLTTTEWNRAFRLNGTSLLREMYHDIGKQCAIRLRDLGDTPYAISNTILDATAIVPGNLARRGRLIGRLEAIREAY